MTRRVVDLDEVELRVIAAVLVQHCDHHRFTGLLTAGREQLIRRLAADLEHAATSGPTSAHGTESRQADRDPRTLPTMNVSHQIAGALTPAQAATVLGVTDRHVRELCASGDLVGTKHADRWAIDPDDLDRYQADRNQSTA